MFVSQAEQAPGIRPLANISCTRALLAAPFTIAAALLAQAEPAATPWLSDSEIEQALKGRTILGVYATGRRFSESYSDSGLLEYVENGITLHGHWSVREGTLCTIYDSDPTGGCFRVTTVGRNCLEFYFVARTEALAPGEPGTPPHWTARGAVEGVHSACPDEASV